jgi:uncharacterized protein YndB with AHSA1/START domain
MIAAMEIRTTLNFPADPETVFTMMTDPGFLEEVSAESGARDCRATVEGRRTISHRTVDAPVQAAKFIGPDIVIVEELNWGEARPDGTRSAVMTLTSPGQPMRMNGHVDLQSEGDGTVVTVSGELTIQVPFVGKKMEQLAAPAIIEGIRAEERVGLRRLSR